MNSVLIWVIVLSLLTILVSIWIIFKRAEQFFKNVISSLVKQGSESKEKFQTQLFTNIDQSTQLIKERLDQQQVHNESIPHHNSTFYFNAHGEAMNLNIESWALELETDLKELIKNNKIGVLTVFIRKNKIIFDKFVLDFKNFSEKHADYLIVQHGVELMKHSELNVTQLHFETLKEFIAGVYATGTIYHHQAANLLIHSFIQHLKPLYETEKARLEKEAADKKALKTAETIDNLDPLIRNPRPAEEVNAPQENKESLAVPDPEVDLAKEGNEGTVYENALVRAILCKEEESHILPGGQIIYNGLLNDCPTHLLIINSEVEAAVNEGMDDEDWIIIYEEKEPAKVQAQNDESPKNEAST
ncbi:MAG: hypothetical protein RDU14_17015 [Melioribacteraceae bacterium]|nr:hypothetical protein [Melioribacteraceae bacterium]